MCSARVSFSHASMLAVDGSYGDGSNADKEDDDDGEQGGGCDGAARAAAVSARPCYPLFIDGIADSVDYFQVRELFLQQGKLTNVFLQRKRKSGRKFRFGFVRYAHKDDAVRAMELLDGVRLGGAYLSVKPEIFSGKMKGRSRHRCSVPAVPRATAKDSQGRQFLPGGSSLCRS
ncbi:uncharacterized protein LOC130736053 [Lotus japonicus]|uniref:uncharacterized protein LOC130736053 n=1 Tax=Lotus japonicus TaxID=34305 RepID=UPI002587084B|nr:uncharacterized protein LOC130736053 [Lotus japonicus]